MTTGEHGYPSAEETIFARAERAGWTLHVKTVGVRTVLALHFHSGAQLVVTRRDRREAFVALVGALAEAANE